jgi:hypothetical protein
MPIEETPGADDANSYISLEDADAYFFHTTKDSEWNDVYDPEASLLHAAVLLDTLDWIGDRATDEQALEWPRISNDLYEVDFDDDEIPPKLQKAQCELALWLSQEAATSAAAAGAVSEMQIGSSVKVKYSGGGVSATVDSNTGLPVDALRYLKGLRIVNVLA